MAMTPEELAILEEKRRKRESIQAPLKESIPKRLGRNILGGMEGIADFLGVSDPGPNLTERVLGPTPYL